MRGNEDAEFLRQLTDGLGASKSWGEAKKAGVLAMPWDNWLFHFTVQAL